MLYFLLYMTLPPEHALQFWGAPLLGKPRSVLLGNHGNVHWQAAIILAMGCVVYPSP